MLPFKTAHISEVTQSWPEEFLWWFLYETSVSPKISYVGPKNQLVVPGTPIAQLMLIIQLMLLVHESPFTKRQQPGRHSEHENLWCQGSVLADHVLISF